MFRTGDKTDFERIVDDILAKAASAATLASVQVQHEAAARGSLLSSGTLRVMGLQLTPIHEGAVGDVMTIVIQFSERTGIAIHDLCEIARPKLAAFTSDITKTLVSLANQMRAGFFVQYQDQFNQFIEHAIQDVEIGFIRGRDVTGSAKQENAPDLSFRAFLLAFGENWLTKMSGPLTVPFTIAALLVPGFFRVLFAILAVVCGVFSSYQVWRSARSH